MNLIYDRTAEDVRAARSGRGTLESKKGCYNVSDMNRVNAAVNELAGLLNAAGYKVTVSTKTVSNGDIIRLSDWVRYLSNVQALKDAFCTLTDGELPAADDKFDYADANTIERILYEIDLLIGYMKENYRRCGAFCAGDNAVHLPLKGSV